MKTAAERNDAAAVKLPDERFARVPRDGRFRHSRNFLVRERRRVDAIA